jgi:hypothetical protein
MAESETSTGLARSAKGGPKGVGRRNRTSNPAVMKGTGAPISVFQPRRSASHTTTAAVWQSSAVAMIPPLRNPNPLSCSARGVNVATVTSVPVTAEVESVRIGVSATETGEVGIQRLLDAQPLLFNAHGLSPLPCAQMA